MSATFSPDGKWLATGSDDHSGARLFDVDSGSLVHLLKGNARTYYAEGVAFDPAGRLLAVPAYESGVELFDVASGALATTFESERFRMREVAISPDGSLLVGVSGESTMRVWNLATGESVDERFVGHNQAMDERLGRRESRRGCPRAGSGDGRRLFARQHATGDERCKLVCTHLEFRREKE